MPFEAFVNVKLMIPLTLSNVMFEKITLKLERPVWSPERKTADK